MNTKVAAFAILFLWHIENLTWPYLLMLQTTHHLSIYVESAKDVKMLIEYSTILNKDFISRFCPVHR